MNPNSTPTTNLVTAEAQKVKVTSVALQFENAEAVLQALNSSNILDVASVVNNIRQAIVQEINRQNVPLEDTLVENTEESEENK